MCKWGNDIILKVPISARSSHTGEFHWDEKPVDSCLADIVQALNNAGIYTDGCCCGHGKYRGSILLQDNRELIIDCRIWNDAEDSWTYKLGAALETGHKTRNS